MKQAQRQAVAVAYSMAKKKGHRAEEFGAEMQTFEANGFPDRNPLNPTRPSDPQNPFERRRRRPKRPLRAEDDWEEERTKWVNSIKWIGPLETKMVDGFYYPHCDYCGDSSGDHDMPIYSANNQGYFCINCLQEWGLENVEDFGAEGDEEFSRRLDKVIQQKRRQQTKKKMVGKRFRKFIRQKEGKLRHRAEGSFVVKSSVVGQIIGDIAILSLVAGLGYKYSEWMKK